MRHPVNIETDCQIAQLQCDVDNNPLTLATGCSGSSSSRPSASFALCTGPIGTDADLPLPAGIALWLIWPGHWSYITFAKFRSMLQIKFGCTRTRDLPSRPDPTRPVPVKCLPDPYPTRGYGSGTGKSAGTGISAVPYLLRIPGVTAPGTTTGRCKVNSYSVSWIEYTHTHTSLNSIMINDLHSRQS